MKSLFVLFSLLLSLAVFPCRSEAQEKGVYHRLDLSDAAVRQQIEKKGAEVVQENGEWSIKLTVPRGGEKSGKMISLGFPIEPIRGSKISIVGMVRGSDITKPPVPWMGVKCQMSFHSPATGPKFLDEGNIFGTFPWRSTQSGGFIPDDAVNGSINLGMQDASGTVWIKDVAIVVMAQKPKRPNPVAAAELTQKAVRYRGFMSSMTFAPQDFKDMAAWNVNLVRWQMSGNKADASTPERYEAWFQNEMGEVGRVLDEAQAYGIKVVIDLHLPPGDRYPDGTLKMVIEPQYRDTFIKNWERIANRFKGHPAILGYDLVNEPAQRRPSPPGMDDWFDIQVRAAKAIRAIDMETPIFIEPDHSADPSSFAMLEAVTVPNVIYQVHMYWPPAFTHQGVQTDQGIAKDMETKPDLLPYPGTFGGYPVDKEALRRYLQPVRDFQLAYNVRIYVGEFSAVRWAPGGAQYLDDLISIFEGYGWDWSYHAFREWRGWSVEHADLPADPKNHPAATQPTDREKVLRKWLLKNDHTPGKNS